MKQHTESVQHSSKESDWRTPPALFAALHQEFHFLLDAAADQDNHLCSHWFGPEQGRTFGHFCQSLEDALEVDWHAYLSHYLPLEHLTVFLNPPYSREQGIKISDWTRKCWEEAQKGLTIVGLIPYSPQTIWWRRDVEGHQGPARDNRFFAAREVRRIPHRVSFLRPDGEVVGNAGGNTAVVVWKPRQGLVMPWVPWTPYWDYLGQEAAEDAEEREGGADGPGESERR